MSHSSFDVGSWLRQEHKTIAKKSDTSEKFSSKKKEQLYFPDHQFRPQDYFLSGWRGESLASKKTISIAKSLNVFEEDVRKEFKSLSLFNKTLKNSIFNEFLTYAESQALHFHEIDNYQIFWQHLEMKNGPYKRELEHFLSIYFFRVASVYLSKLRFIIILSRECNLQISQKDYLNPNSFLTQIFKPGSSLEIKSEALESNHYSWYRPHPGLNDELMKLANILGDVSSTEFFKEVFQKQERQYNLPNESQLKHSHSLSHLGTGIFINTLLLKLPKWLRGENPEQQRSFHQTNLPKVIHCKFKGDHLPSLSLSHWLAQENYMSQKWDNIIRPEFHGSHLSCADFMKICLELQYLTMICTLAKKQGHSPLQYLSHIMNKKNSPIGTEQQMYMFQEFAQKNEARFDRILLNLVEFPKTNPHFYLINQINSQFNNLNDNGLLFVLSNKKLFVPSQSDKVEQLLQKYKLEVVIGLDSVKNKGELAPFIYVFSKNRNNPSAKINFSGQIFSQSNIEDKMSCFNFKFSGDLTTFQKFHAIVDELNHFIDNKKVDSTPLYQSEFNDSFTLEFYQDAIVDGKLINSTKDPVNVTHPNFFKNLMKSCVPLDYFFQIDPLETDQFNRPNISLGLSFKRNDCHPYLLIVDFRNRHQVMMEITTIDVYESKTQEYGFALCFYFGLTPKRNNININLFREFFSSKLGKQMIQFSLYGKMSKLKPRLVEILVPKFFLECNLLPIHIGSALTLLSSEEKTLLSLSANDFSQKFDDLQSTLSWLIPKYPWALMGIMCFFKANLKNCLNNLSSYESGQGIDFNTDFIKQSLVSAPTQKIFPKNDEVFLEFILENQNDIHGTLSNIQLNKKIRHGQISYFLELKSMDKTVLEIYSEPIMLNFLAFLFQHSINYPISTIIQAIRVPRVEYLKTVFGKFENLRGTLEKAHSKTNEYIEQLIQSQIFLPQSPTQ